MPLPYDQPRDPFTQSSRNIDLALGRLRAAGHDAEALSAAVDTLRRWLLRAGRNAHIAPLGVAQAEAALRSIAQRGPERAAERAAEPPAQEDWVTLLRRGR